jgi:hypothetical protein
MSYPATLPSFVSAPVASRQAWRRDRQAPASHRVDDGGLRLFDALRILLREVVHAEAGEPMEPYRACRWCAAGATWCAHGMARVAHHPADESSAPCQPRTPHAPRALHGVHHAPGALHPLRVANGANAVISQAVWLEELAARSAGSSALETPVRLRFGRRADPYPDAEAAAGVTRRLLEALGGLEEGVELSIITRSPLLLRDLDLLLDLDQRHAVDVGVVIPAGDDEVVRRVETRLPPSPSATERFELVRCLASHGISTRVLCTPIVPGVNNSEENLRRLLHLAGQAGASDVVAAPRHPALPPTPYESEHLLPTFERLRLERGFPHTVAGRG